MTKRIFLDIGHGSDTYRKKHSKGIVKPNGEIFEEHQFNSDVAIKIKEKLEKLGVEVDWLQKPHSKEISLRDRVKYINAMHKENPYDLLISLHANASNDGKANGYGVFYWHTNSKGRKFAKNWVKNAKKLLDIKSWGNGVWKSQSHGWTNFYIVRRTLPTAILIEHFFFTNLEELKKCNTSEYIEKFANVTVNTVADYLGLDRIELSSKEIQTIRNYYNFSDDDMKSIELYKNGKEFLRNLLNKIQ